MRGQSSEYVSFLSMNMDSLFPSPPKIKTVKIIDNPFDDIIPRITAEEKRAQHKAREQAQREREEEIRRRGAKKCVVSIAHALIAYNMPGM